MHSEGVTNMAICREQSHKELVSYAGSMSGSHLVLDKSTELVHQMQDSRSSQFNACPLASNIADIPSNAISQKARSRMCQMTKNTTTASHQPLL